MSKKDLIQKNSAGVAPGSATNTPAQPHTERPPVVVVMGHIDHGKSTLLDYIRKTKVVDGEAGGITQHVSAYEIEYDASEQAGATGEHTSPSDHKKRRVTFLDTPGHEAFQTLRSRSTQVADAAILVVSVDDGVKPQTLEALSIIKEQNIPFVVAINKIDKPNTDIEKTKLSLAEKEIYVEGYGGTVSCVPISAKTGEGIKELLEVVFLATDLQELTGDPSAQAQGIIIESQLDSRKGVSATIIIKDGTLRVGQFIAAGCSQAPVRAIQNDLGEKLDVATFSAPVTVVGWSELVPAGAEFNTFNTKEEALASCQAYKASEAAAAAAKNSGGRTEFIPPSEIPMIPVIIKADTLGSLEAIMFELKKIGNERIGMKIIAQGIGTIGESDVKGANTSNKAFIFGFNVKIDNAAKILAERDSVSIELFSIIYKLKERIEALLLEQTPKMMVEEITGSAKILRTFSRQKDRQIIGARLEEGSISVGETVKIIRREVEIGLGRVKGMQQAKKDVSEVKAGLEFGSLVESKFEIAVGDVLRAFKTVEK